MHFNKYERFQLINRAGYLVFAAALHSSLGMANAASTVTLAPMSSYYDGAAGNGAT